MHSNACMCDTRTSVRWKACARWETLGYTFMSHSIHEMWILALQTLGVNGSRMVSHFSLWLSRPIYRVLSDRYIAYDSFQVTYITISALVPGINPNVIRRSCGTRDVRDAEIQVSRDSYQCINNEREREIWFVEGGRIEVYHERSFHGCKDGAGHDSGDNRRSEVGGVGGDEREGTGKGEGRGREVRVAGGIIHFAGVALLRRS